MATLPTAAAPLDAAEAATRRMRTAARKDVVATAMENSGYEPVPACPARQAEAEAPTAG
jgi:hypothetical protein